MMGYGWIFQIVILGLVVLIFWWLLRSNRSGYTNNGSPEDIVKKRYASGEIKKKEYQQLLKDLK